MKTMVGSRVTKHKIMSCYRRGLEFFEVRKAGGYLWMSTYFLLENNRYYCCEFDAVEECDLTQIKNHALFLARLNNNTEYLTFDYAEALLECKVSQQPHLYFPKNEQDLFQHFLTHDLTEAIYCF